MRVVMRKLNVNALVLVCAALLVVAVSNQSFALTVFDSGGFEGYDLGQAHGQAGYIDEGAFLDGDFEVTTGTPATAAQIVDLGGNKVLSMTPGEGGVIMRLQLGWQGNLSNDMYSTVDKTIVTEFDLYQDWTVPGSARVDGYIHTWRTSATEQAKVRLGGWPSNATTSGNLHTILRPAPELGATETKEAEYTLGEWHTIKVEQITPIEHILNDRAIVKVYLDGTELTAGDDWYSLWGSYEGYIGAVDFNFTTATGATFYMDNMRVSYVPEPATIALLGLGGLVLLRRRRAH